MCNTVVQAFYCGAPIRLPIYAMLINKVEPGEEVPPRKVTAVLQEVGWYIEMIDYAEARMKNLWLN